MFNLHFYSPYSCQRTACYKHPGKLWRDNLNLLCLLNIPAELQQISRLGWIRKISFTNFCLSLVVGNVSFECFLIVSWYVTNHLFFSEDFWWFQGVSSSSSRWHKLRMKTQSKKLSACAFSDCSCHTTILQAPEGARVKDSKDLQQRWHQLLSGYGASRIRAVCHPAWSEKRRRRNGGEKNKKKKRDVLTGGKGQKGV